MQLIRLVFPGNWTITEIANNLYSSNTTTRVSYINIDSYIIPAAGFEANTTTGNAPQGVIFNVSDPFDNGTMWNWSFGDGSWQNGTEQNATHTYTVGGTFTVIEYVSNPFFDNQYEWTDYITITAYIVPTVGFTANTTTGNAPQGVEFNVTDPDDNATEWNWSVGDGTWYNGTEQNISHTYTTGGNFTVTEIASNPYFSNTSTRTDYINITSYNQTLAGIVSNTTYGNRPLGVEFNITTEDDNAIWWNWSFGDGVYQNSTRNTTYLYSNGGNYTVNVTAGNPFFISCRIH